jgi:hypothetical protein
MLSCLCLRPVQDFTKREILFKRKVRLCPVIMRAYGAARHTRPHRTAGPETALLPVFRLLYFRSGGELQPWARILRL